MMDAEQGPLRLLAWSRIWSPLVPEAWREDAWQALELPGAWPQVEAAFWPTFHVGLPTPRVPLLLHATLGRDGGRAREDWLRVASHLGLTWSDDRTLPPDHLGIACELLACALRAEEDVLVRELCARYLLPWCEAARARLAQDSGPLGELPARFEADLRSAAETGAAPRLTASRGTRGTAAAAMERGAESGCERPSLDRRGARSRPAG